MHHEPATRVVYRDRPYLLVTADASVVAAYGPFVPGTEPSLAECSAENQVSDDTLVETLMRLLPISPALPSSADTLAGG